MPQDQPRDGALILDDVCSTAAALAHRVKHSQTATRRDAGINADAVILLANIIRRPDQDE